MLKAMVVFSIVVALGMGTLLLPREVRGTKDSTGVAPSRPKVEASVAEKNDACLGCHSKDKLKMWNGISHELEGVACSDCHIQNKTHGQNDLSKRETIWPVQ